MQDLVFEGRVVPKAGLVNGPGLDASQFSDADIGRMNLTGLPLTWEHQGGLAVGLVESTFEDADGHKCVRGRIPLGGFGDVMAQQIESGRRAELSLQHDFEASRVAGMWREDKIPSAVGVVQKGGRPSCLINPNSIRRVAGSDHLRQTIYRAHEGGKKMADEEPQMNVLDFFAEPSNMLNKLEAEGDTMTPQAAAALAAKIAAEGKKHMTQSTEKDTQIAALQEELEKIKATAAAATEAQEADYVTLATKLAEIIAERDGRTPENVLDVLKKVRSTDPAIAMQQGEVLRQTYAFSKDLLEQNAKLQKQVDAYKAGTADKFSSLFNSNVSGGTLDTPAGRFSERPQKRARSEDSAAPAWEQWLRNRE